MRLATATFLAALLAGSGFAAAQTSTPAPATPASPAATAPADTSTAPAPRHRRKSAATSAAATAPTSAAAASTSTAPASAGADEATAKQKCGTDPVVWGNPNSKAYHTSDSRYFGKTKKGSYMCMKDATAAGYHAAGKGAAHAKKPAGSTS